MLPQPFRTILLLLVIAFFNGCDDDTTSPTALDSFGFRRVGGFTTPGSARDLWLTNDTVYVADDELGVTVWKMTADGRATLLDTVSSAAPAVQVAYAEQSRLLFALVKPSWNEHVMMLDRSADDQYLAGIGNKGIEDFFVQSISPDTLLVYHCGIDPYGIQETCVYWDMEFNSWQEYIQGAFTSDLRAYHGMEKSGANLYVAQGQWGLQIFRTDGATIGDTPFTKLGTLDLPGNACDVAVDPIAQYAYLACQFAGLAVVNVSNVDQPQIVAQFIPDGVDDAFEVAVDGNTVYLLDWENGLFAIDVTIRNAPRLIGAYHTPRPSSVTVRADHTVFLTDEYQGVILLKR